MKTDLGAWQQTLYRRMRHLSLLARRLRQLQTALTQDVPAALQRHLQAVQKTLQPLIEEDWTSWFHELDQTLQALQAEMPVRWQRWHAHWLQRLREALGVNEAGLTVQGGWVVYGFLRLQPDLERDRVTVYYGPERLTVRSADPVALARWIQRWIGELQRRALAPERFVDLLRDAYRRAQRGEPRVPIQDVYRHMVLLRQSPTFWADANTHHFTPYPRYLFSYELATLRAHPEAWCRRFRIQLIAASLEATRRRIGYVWVPEGAGPEGSRYAYLVIEPISGELL